jgi:hypothetical protein
MFLGHTKRIDYLPIHKKFSEKNSGDFLKIYQKGYFENRL